MLKLYRKTNMKQKVNSASWMKIKSMDIEKCATKFNVIFVIYQNILMEYYTSSGHYYKENFILSVYSINDVCALLHLF